MTEVIELLSSSLPPTPVSARYPPAPTINKTKPSDYSDFDVDDFDETGSLDFSIDRPIKRARLSPKLASNLGSKKFNAAAKKPLAFNLDVVSDNGLTPEYERQPILKSTRNSSRQNEQAYVLEEIAYSSSAPEPLLSGKKQLKKVEQVGKSLLDGFFDDDDDDEVFISQSQPEQPEYDHRTANLLAALAQGPGDPVKGSSRLSKPKSTQNLAKGKVVIKDIDDIEFSSPVRAKPSKSLKLTEDEKISRAVERATQRAAAKSDKEAAKQADKARRLVEKEQKGREKQKAADLAEVNKSRTNKKDATPEMILDMSSLLKNTSVGNQVEKRMDNIQVEVSYVDEEINMIDDRAEQEQYGSIITWRRKVKSVYNDENDQWEPINRPHIVKERHVLIHLPAADFAAVAAVSRAGLGTSILRTEIEMKANLDAHVVSIRRRFGDCVPVYLIEGLRNWLKKNSNAKNRAYTAAVRAQILQTEADAEPSASQTRIRKRKKPSSESLDLSHVTSDIVDDLLLHLQLAHQPILIHHTPTPADSASQISALTQHLSTRPYRLAQLEYNLKSASFCMDSGQVRTGDNTEDTFVKMLQEVQRVTPSMALGIANKYKTVRKLVKGFDKHGNLLLEDVRKALNTDGGWSDKRLGPQVSKRLFKVFMGRDPTATDGMS